MTTDRNGSSLSFARFLTNPQTYGHAAWHIGNQGLSAHEAIGVPLQQPEQQRATSSEKLLQVNSMYLTLRSTGIVNIVQFQTLQHWKMLKQCRYNQKIRMAVLG